MKTIWTRLRLIYDELTDGIPAVAFSPCAGRDRRRVSVEIRARLIYRLNPRLANLGVELEMQMGRIRF